jgi:hypothetical protein
LAPKRSLSAGPEPATALMIRSAENKVQLVDASLAKARDLEITVSVSISRGGKAPPVLVVGRPLDVFGKEIAFNRSGRMQRITLRQNDAVSTAPVDL